MLLGVRFRRILLVLAAGCLVATAAVADTIIVAPAEVTVDNNGVCSLREAIHNANTDTQADNTDCAKGSGADVIDLAAGSVYILPDEDEADSGLPLVSSEIEIDGNGATVMRDENLTCLLNGTKTPDEFRIVTIDAPGDLTLNDLTLTNGCADGTGLSAEDGGAIKIGDLNSSLTLNRTTVFDNSAFGVGGGLDNGDSVTNIVDSTFRDNFANGGAGAAFNGGGNLNVERSTFTNNSADGLGGGGIVNAAGYATIVNSTISGNRDISTSGGGGGIYSPYLGLALESSTVWGNASTGSLGGGGIFSAAYADVKNSIVGGSTQGGDCVDKSMGNFSASGTDFDTDGTCAAIDPDFTQVTSGQLALGSLANYGGPTETHALLSGSVAIDSVGDCTLLDNSTPVTEDQRGVARPQRAACDAGAFEAEPTSVVAVPALGLRGFLLLGTALLGLGLWWLRR